MKTLTLENASNVSLVLEVDLGGNLNLNGSDGVITVPILNAWGFLMVKMDDGAGNIRNLTSNLTGGLLFNNVQLAILTDLSAYTTTAGINTLLSAYTTATGINTLLSAYTNTTGINTLLNSYTTLSSLNSVLSNYTPTNSMNTLLNAKQPNLIAGNNITISNNTISSTGGGSGSGLTLQLDGVTQTATTLNFVSNNALLSGGVLNVSRLIYYDKIPLIYGSLSTIKDITQDSASNLLWGTDILTTNTYLTNVLSSYATTASVNSSLSNYTIANSMNTLLNAKVDDSQV